MPYLIADPQLAVDVDYYEVELDGVVTRSDPERDDPMVRLHHDLSGVSPGEHTTRVRSVNQWGGSDWSGPLSFTSALPPAPTNLGIAES